MTTTADWTILDQPNVGELITRSARDVHSMYQHNPNYLILWEVQDLEQEARIIVAVEHERYRECLPDDLGLFRTRLVWALRDATKTQREHAKLERSLDRMMEKGREPDIDDAIQIGGRPNLHSVRADYYGLDAPDDV